ncbi:MAG: ABC transporter ATP-binding protein/permease [Clostridia bacterium]|nr:ABC transporter ATP-binding protein/permease [Clostridia bacterium]
MKDLLVYLKRYIPQSILAPLFKLLEASFELLIPFIVAAVVDKINAVTGGEVAASVGAQYVTYACLILVALGVVGLVSAVCAQYFAAKAATGFSKELRSDMFRKVQSLSYYEIDNLGTSALITRMTSDVNQVQTGVNMVLRLFMRSPFIVFGALILAFVINTMAGWVFAVTIAVLFIIVFGIMAITIPMYKKSQGKLDKVTAATRETLVGSRVVRAFCKEDEEIAEFSKRNNGLTKSQKFVGGISALMNPLTYAVINVGIIVLIYVGGGKVYSGDLTQGQVIALYNYMGQILVELIKLANLIITVTKCFACAGRVNEILKMQPSLKHCASAQSVEGAPFIKFNNVSMRYFGGGSDALSGISFTVNAGETVGVIGGTGSGKSTLVNLIPHFYDATEGEVTLGGVNVNAVGDEALRAECGVVPQRAVLFKGTIRENIKWGNEDATDEDINEAIALACASEVVAGKPDGLDELVEQGGKNFSGGQRQRLTIARALVKKPKILILDDSASALDYATDAALRKNLRSLDYNPTVFLVSQRTSSVRFADKILVLDGGNLVGCGTHDELLKTCDVYKEIHLSQYGGADGAATPAKEEA